MKRVPVITGGLAALAGFLAVRGTNLANIANYKGTQGVLHQTQASDAWAEYQADSIKKHIDLTALKAGTLPPAAADVLRAEAAEDAAREIENKKKAEAAKAICDAEQAESTGNLDEKDYCDYAGVAAQLGIALASVAALTRRQSAFNTAVLVGLAAVGLTAYGLIVHHAGMVSHYFHLLLHR